MKNQLFIITTIVSVVFLSGCYYDTAELLYPGGMDCSGVAPSYSTTIAPLIQSKCAMGGCHSAGVTNSGGPLTNYNENKAKAAAIKTTVLNGSMPKGMTMTADEIKAINCWVDNGSLNN